MGEGEIQSGKDNRRHAGKTGYTFDHGEVLALHREFMGFLNS
jgi:hypothetical protein